MRPLKELWSFLHQGRRKPVRHVTLVSLSQTPPTVNPAPAASIQMEQVQIQYYFFTFLSDVHHLLVGLIQG